MCQTFSSFGYIKTHSILVCRTQHIEVKVSSRHLWVVRRTTHGEDKYGIKDTCK